MTVLSDKMRKLADSGHPKAAELRDHAAKFDEAYAGFWGEPPTVNVKSFMGVWARARARLFWREVSGEPLI